MAIWLVEDDPKQAQQILDVLRSAFPAVGVERLKTEEEFLTTLSDGKRPPPDVVVFDVMLAWTEIGEAGTVSPAPPGYDESGGYLRAGIRCAKALWSNPATQATPAILFSVLSNGDLRSDMAELEGRPVQFLSKKEPPEKLVALLRSLLRTESQV